MDVIRWDPFREMDRFFDLHRRQMLNLDMAVDVYKEKNNLVAEMHVPGVDPKNIEVSVDHGCLHVQGKREEKKERKDKAYYSREIRKGSFERTLRLPANVDEKKVKAEYANGVLKVMMPLRKSIPQSGKIKVKVNSK